MKTLSIAALSILAVLAWPCPTASALDFTIHHTQASADGASLDSTYILDQDSKIFMRIPRKWQISDSPGALELIPNVADCRVKIENVSGVQSVPLDAPGEVVLRKLLDGSVPSGAKNTLALPDTDNPLPIFGWKDVEMARTYDFYGQTICHSIMFLNMRPGRVVQLSITAPKADYDAIHDAVRLLMFSWFEPSKDLSKETARKLEEGTLGGS